MLGSHHGVLEGFVEPLVFDHFVELCISAGFDISVGCFNGFALQQRPAEHGQVCTPMAPFDAVDKDVVPVLARRLSTAQTVLGCKPPQRS